VTLLSAHAFEQRLTQLETRLDHLGQTTTSLSGGRHRKVKVTCHAPGIPGLLELAVFQYEEWFTAFDEDRLLRTRYHYNYLDVARGGRRGYHLHPINGQIEDTPHLKCLGADGSGDANAHYFAYEVDLWAAHEAFERLYADQKPLSCRGLIPID
jgi:hypothetical protein